LTTAPALRVALVHDWLTGMRGGEKVLEAIARSFPGAPIFTLFHFPGAVGGALEERPIHTSFLQRAPGIRRYYRHYLPLFPAAVEDLDLTGFDLVISSSHCVAKGVVPPPGSHHICYCHTPMRYAWDQERAYFPRRRGLTARLRGLALTGLRAWDVTASRRVDHFLANSRFVAERIRRYYGRPADVLHPPVAVDFFTPRGTGEDAKEGVGEGTREYVLVVCALAPYKRLDLAIGACRKAGVELRIVGTGPEEKALRQMARDSGSPVRFLGRVSGEALRDLYRDALCLLQPGVEDFGIAPVEALACGTPVVATGRGGVLDIVEDGQHGHLVPEQPEKEDEAAVRSLAEAIDKTRQTRFNSLDLRSRAETFAPALFTERLMGFVTSRERSI
jgi:glycosyltransferase involved in cell wall biosynthesis